MRKIVTVLGARPQFVKASVVSHALVGSGAIRQVVVHTGQHFDANMSRVFFSDLGMEQPAHNLGIHGGGHGVMTGRMLAELEPVLLAERPNAVLVYGDTNSTLAAALAAAKLQIPVAHVEAGLRSFNMNMPEEVNRILTDRISRWLFTPTEAAELNLVREGIPGERILPVGDVMYDVALHYGAKASGDISLLNDLRLEAGGYVLATIHRAENTNDPRRMTAILDALEAISESARVVWPLHPRTRQILQSSGRLANLASGIMVLDPVGYLDMIRLEMNAAAIVTDSGGVQKEAFFFRVPCVTLRDETEWVELIDSGWNRLAPPADADTVQQAVEAAIGRRGSAIQPYGHGDAAAQIVRHLLETV